MDNINNPQHYKQASVTIEPIDVLRFAPFDLGNALKYIIRAGFKGSFDDAKQDVLKAEKYFDWSLESFHVDCEPYHEFFMRYGMFLRKFDRLRQVYGFGEIGCIITDLKREFGV